MHGTVVDVAHFLQVILQSFLFICVCVANRGFKPFSLIHRVVYFEIASKNKSKPKRSMINLASDGIIRHYDCYFHNNFTKISVLLLSAQFWLSRNDSHFNIESSGFGVCPTDCKMCAVNTQVNTATTVS